MVITFLPCCLALEQISLLALSAPIVYATFVVVVGKQTAAGIAFVNVVVVVVGVVGLRRLHMQASAKNLYNFQTMPR